MCYLYAYYTVESGIKQLNWIELYFSIVHRLLRLSYTIKNKLNILRGMQFQATPEGHYLPVCEQKQKKNHEKFTTIPKNDFYETRA